MWEVPGTRQAELERTLIWLLLKQTQSPLHDIHIQLLGLYAGRQHQMLQLLRAWQRCAGKVTGFNRAVKRQRFPVQTQMAPDFMLQPQGADSRFGPQLHHHGITQGLRVFAFTHPAPQFLPPRWQHLIEPLAAACRFDGS